MNVILMQDVKGLGKKGDFVSTSDGYARNFLFPRKLAMAANAQAMSELKNREASEKHRLAEELASAKELAARLEGKTIKLSARAGSSGKLFGSITAKVVAEQIEKEFNVELDKRKVAVEDIKSYGTYPVEVKLHGGVSASLYVLVGE